MITWESDQPMVLRKPSGLEWVLVVGRVLAVLALTNFLLFALILAILFRKITGKRKAQQSILKLWGRGTALICGIELEVRGKLLKQGEVLVCNHVSWLDIVSLLGVGGITFVSKAEIAKWPVIGQLAKLQGTVFIDRKRSKAKEHTEILASEVRKGKKLCFFPEGTSTDGLGVVEFKTPLFEIFRSEEFAGQLKIQPITLHYQPQKNLDPRFFGWWGDMAFGAHVLSVVSVKWPGKITVTIHAPVQAADFENRKELARYCEGVVRSGLS